MVSATPAPRQGLAVASLVLGIVGLFTLGILGIGALLGIVFGVMALVKANNEPAEYGGKGKAVAGIALSVLSVVVMPFLLGIVAAIAIPSLLRVRVNANETAVIGDMRTVAAAEAAYRSANGGYFDTPSCLGNPSRCIPGHTGPALLEPRLSRLESRHGYSPWFHAGPGAPAGPRISPSSLTAFAFGLVPVAPGHTGVRSFCTDETGRICAYEAGRTEEADALVSCPADCQSLR